MRDAMRSLALALLISAPAFAGDTVQRSWITGASSKTVRAGLFAGGGGLACVQRTPTIGFLPDQLVQSGGKVTQWTEMFHPSGTMRTVTQGTAGEQPDYSTLANGCPVADFDGTADNLERTAEANFPEGTSGEVWAAFVHDNDSGVAYLLASSDFDDGAAGTKRMSIQANNGGDKLLMQWIGETGGPSNSNYAQFGGPLDTTPQVGRWGSTGTAYFGWYGGSSQTITFLSGIGTDDGNWFGDVPVGRDSMTIGCRHNATENNFMDGKIACILYFEGVNLTDQQALTYSKGLAAMVGATVP